MPVLKIGTGLAIGATAVILAPIVIPAVAGISRSLAKAGIKGGMILYNRGKIAVEGAREVFDDLVAEARDEVSKKRANKERI